MSEEQQELQLPTSGNTENPKEKEEQERQKHALIIQLIDKNRKDGIDALDKAIDVADHAGVDPVVKKGLKGALTSLEAINSLVDFIKHDLIHAIHNLDEQSKGNYQAAAHLQALIKSLNDKGIVNDQDLRDAWKEIEKETAPKEQVSDSGS